MILFNIGWEVKKRKLRTGRRRRKNTKRRTNRKESETGRISTTPHPMMMTLLIIAAHLNRGQNLEIRKTKVRR
jgi:hypothetical protein